MAVGQVRPKFLRVGNYSIFINEGVTMNFPCLRCDFYKLVLLSKDNLTVNSVLSRCG